MRISDWSSDVCSSDLMFAGVTYSYFVANAVLATEIFLIFHTLLALVIALVVHVAGMMLCLREPRFFDLWLTRVGRCPRVRNFSIWRLIGRASCREGVCPYG